MRARDVMSTDVVTVAAKATLLTAAELMINAGVSGLPVTDDTDAVVGFLSEYDLIRRVMGGGDEAPSALQTHLEDSGALAEAYASVMAEPVTVAMIEPVLTVREDTPLKEVADLMLKHRTRSIPVVRGASAVGIIARVDLVKALLSRPQAGAKAATPSAAVPEVGDDQLRRDVITSLRRLGLPLGGGFDVVSQRGVIHLWGEVAEEESHRAYQGAAARVAGVRDVYSHMQVIPQRRRDGLRR